MRLKYNRNSGRIRGKGKNKKARRRKKRDEREISAEQARNGALTRPGSERKEARKRKYDAAR
jgi:hypothetical protein